MKNIYTKTVLIALTLGAFCFQGCQKRGSVWDQDKTAMHFKDSASAGYWGEGELSNDKEGVFGLGDDDFISLNEEDLRSQFADAAIPQSNKTPGEPGSGIPGIQHFKNPTDILASIFRNVHFHTNEHIIRSQEYINTLAKVAQHLKEHPNLYIFVSGHADERGPEAFNLALGARRSNYIRTVLVKKGVNPEQIFTISYGKEKPVDFGHNHRSWAKNRRAEFKIYEK